MKIPFLDLKKIYTEQSAEIEASVQRVLRSGWYLLGEECSSFEHKMKSQLLPSGEGYIVGCNSGTDALILSLLAADIGSGDEVITVSHTAIPTIAAIVAVGATPVFCEIDSDTLVMDLSKVRVLLSNKTKAIIPVHIYGNMVDIFALQSLLKAEKREDITIIEDCAQAQGSTLKNSAAGTIGRFGAYSFYPSKNLGALGDGGAIFCKTEADQKKLRMLRFYGQESRYKAELLHGINSRLDEVQAAVLNTRLSVFDKWNEKKRQFVKLYQENLSGLPISLQKVTTDCNPAWHLFVILLKNSQTREKLMSFLTNQGIETLIHYPMPTHLQNSFKNFKSSDLAVSESTASRVLSLPMNSAMTTEEVLHVATSVRNFFSQL